MRRSMAPSVLRQRAQDPNGCNATSSTSALEKSGSFSTNKSRACKNADDNVTIERMPLFGFLTIPDALKRQFVIPKGCVVTAESIRLRKFKTLGASKNFTILKPGGMKSFVPVLAPMADELGDENDDGAEDLPTVNLPPFEPLILWRDNAVSEDPDIPPHRIEVIPTLASKLRPHQREGVQFLFECTMGLRGFNGNGCILADDMGLGKTLMSITLLWTLMNQGFVKGESAVKKVMVVCPVSLVGNWDNEIKRWVGDGCNTYPVTGDAKATIKNYINYRGRAVLIISYDQQRNNAALFSPNAKFQKTTQCLCDLLICDEAHKLKNADSGMAKALNTLPAKMRILLSGTPMQNELEEFFNMVNFCNPGVLETISEFKRRYERPILASREPDASPQTITRAAALQKELSTIVNEFILKRGNALNAQHLPPKLVQYVCCRLTPEQGKMYDTLLSSKEMNHMLVGKMENTLEYIRYMIRICCHPKLVYDTYCEQMKEGKKGDLLRDAASIYSTALPAQRDDANRRAISGQRTGVPGLLSSKPSVKSEDFVDPLRSGKLFVLYRMMQVMRQEKKGERIVIVSNYTSVLRMISSMCEVNKWPHCTLSGEVTGTNRTKMVAKFNDPMGSIFAFLLSSKAGGCGINLIGGNRLVLFDADWNPANDKQAAGRIWREGQKKRCFIYRFMSTGTIEEKIVQRQLSKESLQNIVEDKDSFAKFSSADLKDLFSPVVQGTPSDTHDMLQCKRCSTVRVKDTAAVQAAKHQFNDDRKAKCIEFLTEFTTLVCEVAARHVETESPAGPEAAGPEAAVGELREFPRIDLDTLVAQIESNAFATLPEFIRKIRATMMALHREQTEPIDGIVPVLPRSFSLQEEFMKRWEKLVPALQAMRTQKAAVQEVAKKRMEEEGEEEEEEDWVEQVGCPEDTDLKNWQHHTSVQTCDDDLLKRAMGDDDTINFVFGCEVNWTLLQLKDAEEKEEKEARKRQHLQDLAELNQRRDAERQAKAEKAARDAAAGGEVDVDVPEEKRGRKQLSKKVKKDSYDDDLDDTVVQERARSARVPKRKTFENTMLDDQVDVEEDFSTTEKKAKRPAHHAIVITLDDDEADLVEDRDRENHPFVANSVPMATFEAKKSAAAPKSRGVPQMTESRPQVTKGKGKLLKKAQSSPVSDDGDVWDDDEEIPQNAHMQSARPLLGSEEHVSASRAPAPTKKVKSASMEPRRDREKSCRDDSTPSRRSETEPEHVLPEQSSENSVPSQECAYQSWECSSCTYINDPSMFDVECGMCGDPSGRPKIRRKR